MTGSAVSCPPTNYLTEIVVFCPGASLAMLLMRMNTGTGPDAVEGATVSGILTSIRHTPIIPGARPENITLAESTKAVPIQTSGLVSAGTASVGGWPSGGAPG